MLVLSSTSSHYSVPFVPHGQMDLQQNEVGHQKKSLLLEDQIARCGSRSQNQNQSQGTSGDEKVAGGQPLSRQMKLPILENGQSHCNGNVVNGSVDVQEEMQVSLSPLRERLAAIEGITANLQNWQSKEKTEYEQCVSDLATQVSRAVALQQLMKSEVEKLQQRVVHLENHNKAMATMIIPTLMKLHDTVGKESGSKTEKTDVCEDRSGKSSPTSEKENKLSQQQCVKSPKHRKIDCRIPRMNSRSNGCNSSMTSSAPNPALSVNNEAGSEERPQTGKVRDSVSVSGKSSRTACVESSPSLSLSLSPSHTKRADHSTNSSTAQTHQNGGRVSCQRSSTYSGIPRMASPRPANRTAPTASKQTTANNAGISNGGKENKSRRSSSTGHREPIASSTPISKLPIRKNLSNSSTSSSSSSSSTKGKSGRGSNSNKSNTHPKTTSPSPLSTTTMNGKGSLGSKIDTNTYVKSKPTSSTLLKAMAMTVSGTTNVSVNATSTSPSVSGKPKAGKDEGYSTMSSEALAEQEKESQGMVSSPGSSIIKSNTFNTLREMKLMGGDNNPNSYNNYTNLHNNKNGGGVRGRAGGEPGLIQSLPKEKFQMMCNGSVRIYRGTPYDVEIGVEGEADSEEQSTSTILWEDSDDSDILFLPLEMSSELESTIGSSSRSTLVPSVSSISYREKVVGTPSSRSSASRMSSNGKTGTTQILLTSDKEREGSFPTPPARKGITTNGKGELVILNGGGGGTSDEIEERALIEKWMRLEDVRNEVQWDDEWAWDWDGVERTHKSLQTHTQQSLIPLRTSTTAPEDVDADVDFWFSSPSSSENSPEKVCGVGVGQKKEAREMKCGQIDSSTWTKSKSRRLKCKVENEEESATLQLNSNSLESRKKQETFSSPENEKEIPGLINGDCGKEVVVELEEEMEVARRENTDTSSQFLRSPSPSPTTASSKDVEDTAAPVIEFTPEFYHLVNYGSNLSFSDNDSSSHSHHISHSNSNTNQRTKEKSVKSSPRKCKSSIPTSPNSRMDDKISQTDFSSSHENLSVSSELFTECRNCLEIIKKLVGSTAISLENCGSSEATLDRQQKHERAEMQTDVGCATTWLSVPKGLPTTEVDRILEILSSSESEDVLSPSK